MMTSPRARIWHWQKGCVPMTPVENLVKLVMTSEYLKRWYSGTNMNKVSVSASLLLSLPSPATFAHRDHTTCKFKPNEFPNQPWHEEGKP